MVNVPIKKLRPGMITATSIYNSKGGSYLTRGVAVNSQYIDRLRKLGVQSLPVTSISPDIALPPPPDVVQEQTRVEAIHSVFNCFENMKQGMLKVDDVEKSSHKILMDVVNSKGSLVQLTDIRTHDTYTFAHSVNVAILSAMLGIHLGLPEEELLLIIRGAMLHDIGKVVVPGEILNKAGRLTDNEMAVIRLHPVAGSRRIIESGIPDAPILAKMAAQHHEHMSGKGYPNRLMENDIHPYAKIVMLADVYDALTANRPYKQPYRPHVAHRIMTTCSVGQFDEVLLGKFFNTVALYPVGTVMKTNYGYAIVREVAFSKSATPTVILFTYRDGNLRSKPALLDMADFPGIVVEGVTEDRDLFPLILQLRTDPSIYMKEDIDSFWRVKHLTDLN